MAFFRSTKARSQQGNHSVTLTVTDSYGLVTTENIDFMVNTPPTAPICDGQPCGSLDHRKLAGDRHGKSRCRWPLADLRLFLVPERQLDQPHDFCCIERGYHQRRGLDRPCRGNRWLSSGLIQRGLGGIQNTPPTINGTTISPTSPNDSDAAPRALPSAPTMMPRPWLRPSPGPTSAAVLCLAPELHFSSVQTVQQMGM